MKMASETSDRLALDQRKPFECRDEGWARRKGTDQGDPADASVQRWEPKHWPNQKMVLQRAAALLAMRTEMVLTCQRVPMDSGMQSTARPCSNPAAHAFLASGRCRAQLRLYPPA